MIQVEYTGHVHYILIAHYVTRCVPSEEQFNCTLTYGSWAHNAGQISVNNSKQEIDLSEYNSESSSFKIVTTDAVVNTRNYSCCLEDYQDITYTITLEWKDSDTFEGVSDPYVGNGASKSSGNGTITTGSDVNIAKSTSTGSDNIANGNETKITSGEWQDL